MIEITKWKTKNISISEQFKISNRKITETEAKWTHLTPLYRTPSLYCPSIHTPIQDPVTLLPRYTHPYTGPCHFTAQVYTPLYRTLSLYCLGIHTPIQDPLTLRPRYTHPYTGPRHFTAQVYTPLYRTPSLYCPGIHTSIKSEWVKLVLWAKILMIFHFFYVVHIKRLCVMIFHRKNIYPIMKTFIHTSMIIDFCWYILIWFCECTSLDLSIILFRPTGTEK